MMPQPTPNEALLKEQIATLRVENEALKQENEQLKQDIKVLRLKVDAMARKLFGKSSEPERSGDRQPQAARRA